MSKLIKLLNQVRTDENGTALLEYSILLGIVVTAGVAFATPVGTWIAGKWTGLCTALSITC